MAGMTCDSGSRSESRDAKQARGEARQSGGDSRIAQMAPEDTRDKLIERLLRNCDNVRVWLDNGNHANVAILLREIIGALPTSKALDDGGEK
jgi:hypothetical protein